jgi:hypothetical protein
MCREVFFSLATMRFLDSLSISFNVIQRSLLSSFLESYFMSAQSCSDENFSSYPERNAEKHFSSIVFTKSFRCQLLFMHESERRNVLSIKTFHHSSGFLFVCWRKMSGERTTKKLEVPMMNILVLEKSRLSP